MSEDWPDIAEHPIDLAVWKLRWRGFHGVWPNGDQWDRLEFCRRDRVELTHRRVKLGSDADRALNDALFQSSQ